MVTVPTRNIFAVPCWISAATAAAWGAEALVPKKFGKASPSMLNPPKLTVVLTPLGAIISGLFLFTPLTGVPPLDENEAAVGGSTPNSGVLLNKHGTHRDCAGGIGLPYQCEPPFVPKSLTWISPLNTMYFMVAGPVPAVLTMMKFDCDVSLTTVKGNTSMGAPPVFTLLNPNKVVPTPEAR